MKKNILMFLLLGLFSIPALAQVKKPSLMVIPNDTWCFQYSYTKEFDNQGTVIQVPDYEKAFMENAELKTAITAIGAMMQNRGFPLKDMEQTIKSMAQDRAEDMIRTSKSGSEILETPLDQVLKRAKCDIVIDLLWKVNQMGARKSLTYNIRALDAYTNKQIAGVTGTGDPTGSTELAVMLDEAISGSLDGFNDQLMLYFTDMSEKGREVSMSIRLWDDAMCDLEEEFDDGPLMDIIEDWVSDHTVNGSYNLTDATETFMEFEQIRIPLLNEKGKGLDARRWARDLSKELEEMGVPNKLTMRGLGKVTIIIGGK